MSISTSGDLVYNLGPNGATFEDTRPKPMLFKITGGSNPYAADELILDPDAGTTSTANGMVLTAAMELLWELRGVTTVAANTVVWAYPNPLGAQTGWIFEAQPQTGNVATEASGSTATMPAHKWQAVKPLRVRGPATARTIALIPPNEDDTGYVTADLVTNVCPTIKYLSGTVTIGETTYGVTFALSDTTSTGAVQVQTNTTVEYRPVKVIAGSIGAATCVVAPDDCCNDCPDCTCEGLTKLEVGTNTFTDVAVTAHDGIAEGEFYMSWTLDWLFCPPNGNCSYTVTATSVAATYSGTCINPSFFGAPFVYLEAKSLDGTCEVVSTLDTDSQDGTCPSTFPTATITIPAAETDCARRRIRFTINVYSDTDSPSATADFVITITEAVCA